MLDIKNLTFSYNNHPVLRDLTCKLSEGQLVCLLGQNGAGKTTLFKCILRLLKNYSGHISINNQNTAELDQRHLAAKIAYIPQCHSSVFDFSVLDMVLMGTTSKLPPFTSPGPEQTASAAKALETLGILHLSKRPYRELSGGEQQLVLIARALAQDALLLIMDEPCSNLDYGNQIHLMRTLKELSKKGYLILLSTHNVDHAMMYADQVLILHDSSLAVSGSPKEVITEEAVKLIYGLDVSITAVPGSSIHLMLPKEFCGHPEKQRSVTQSGGTHDKI